MYSSLRLCCRYNPVPVSLFNGNGRRVEGVLMTSWRSRLPGEPESTVAPVGLDIVSALVRNDWIFVRTAASGRIEAGRSDCTDHRDALWLPRPMNDCAVTSDALTCQGLDLATSTFTQADAQAATICINPAHHAVFE